MISARKARANAYRYDRIERDKFNNVVVKEFLKNLSHNIEECSNSGSFNYTCNIHNSGLEHNEIEAVISKLRDKGFTVDTVREGIVIKW